MTPFLRLCQVPHWWLRESCHAVKTNLWLFLIQSQAVLQLLSLCSSQELERTGVQEEDHASGDIFRRLNHLHILWRSLSLFVCICVSICIYICMYAYSCVLCVYIYVGVCVSMSVCMCVWACLSVYMSLWLYMCMYICACIFVHVCLSMCMYISVCLHKCVCVCDCVCVCFRKNKVKLEKENTF